MMIFNYEDNLQIKTNKEEIKFRNDIPMYDDEN